MTDAPDPAVYRKLTLAGAEADDQRTTRRSGRSPPCRILTSSSPRRVA